MRRDRAFTAWQILRQFEYAEMEFILGRLGPHQRKRGTRELVPDREIFRHHREPPELKHVAAGFGHASDLLPGDLGVHGPLFLVRKPADSIGRRAMYSSLSAVSLERTLAQLHLEHVELYGKHRQCQPQVVQLFNPRLIPVV